MRVRCSVPCAVGGGGGAVVCLDGVGSGLLALTRFPWCRVRAGQPWRCPACQFVYTEVPVYRCFCGRTKRPEENAFVTPHSCGGTCGRTRARWVPAYAAARVRRPCEIAVSGLPACLPACLLSCVECRVVCVCACCSGCPHRCDLQCHPGPCPPCTAMSAPKRCGCRRTVYHTRCGQPDPGRSCGAVVRTLVVGVPAVLKMWTICVCACADVWWAVWLQSLFVFCVHGCTLCVPLQCGKPLSCRHPQHRCTRVCHTGPCNSCEEPERQWCYCGAQCDVRSCGSGKERARSRNIKAGEVGRR